MVLSCAIAAIAVVRPESQLLPQKQGITNRTAVLTQLDEDRSPIDEKE